MDFEEAFLMTLMRPSCHCGAIRVLARTLGLYFLQIRAAMGSDQPDHKVSRRSSIWRQ